jgi:hypothetical protein
MDPGPAAPAGGLSKWSNGPSAMSLPHHTTYHSHTFLQACVFDYNTNAPDETQYELRDSGPNSPLVAILRAPVCRAYSRTLYSDSTKAELCIRYKGFICKLSSVSNPPSTPPTTGRSLLEYNGIPAAPVAIQPDTSDMYLHNEIHIKRPTLLSTVMISLDTQLSTTLEQFTKPIPLRPTHPQANNYHHATHHAHHDAVRSLRDRRPNRLARQCQGIKLQLSKTDLGPLQMTDEAPERYP